MRNGKLSIIYMLFLLLCSIRSEKLAAYKTLGKFITRGMHPFVDVRLLFYIGRSSDDDLVDEVDEAHVFLT